MPSTPYQTTDTVQQIIGGTASDVVGFHGTAADQAAAITSPASTGATSSSPYGFTTAAQADALVTAVRSILVALREKGLIAS